MAPTKKGKSSATAEAKVEAVAKASYEVKKKITEVVPADVTRAKASAWLDLISPFTEWAGLKGDQLRHKRELLRLQREDVLSEIAKRARMRLAKSASVTSPIPNKFLVPFLEKASLEDSDGLLVDLWANLFVSAAENYSSHYVHFANIISQMSKSQGEILIAIIGIESSEKLAVAMDSIQSYFQASQIRQSLDQDYQNRFGKKLVPEIEDIGPMIAKLMNSVGIAGVHCAVDCLAKKDLYHDIDEFDTIYSDELEVDFSILEALGLIRRVEMDWTSIGAWAFRLIYYHLTTLGEHFARACKIVH